MTTQRAVDEYIQKSAVLLDLERAEEELRARTGRNILGEIGGFSSGLGGCVMLRIEKLSLVRTKDEEAAGGKDPGGGKGQGKGKGKGKGKGGGKGRGKGGPAIVSTGGVRFRPGDPVTLRKPNDEKAEVRLTLLQCCCGCTGRARGCSGYAERLLPLVW